MSPTSRLNDRDAALFGGRSLTHEVPSTQFPDTGMSPVDARRLLDEDLALEGDPQVASAMQRWLGLSSFAGEKRRVG